MAAFFGGDMEGAEQFRRLGILSRGDLGRLYGIVIS